MPLDEDKIEAFTCYPYPVAGVRSNSLHCEDSDTTTSATRDGIVWLGEQTDRRSHCHRNPKADRGESRADLPPKSNGGTLAVEGVSSEGFATTVLPITSAGAT